MILNSIPTINQKYRWNDSDVIVKAFTKVTIPEKHHADGSYSPSRDRYSVQIEDVTPDGRFEGDVIWTAWTTRGFEV